MSSFCDRYSRLGSSSFRCSVAVKRRETPPGEYFSHMSSFEQPDIGLSGILPIGFTPNDRMGRVARWAGPIFPRPGRSARPDSGRTTRAGTTWPRAGGQRAFAVRDAGRGPPSNSRTGGLAMQGVRTADLPDGGLGPASAAAATAGMVRGRLPRDHSDPRAVGRAAATPARAQRRDGLGAPPGLCRTHRLAR